MSEEEQLRSETLVEIQHAHNEWEGNLLVSYLSDNGVEATLQLPPAIAPLDAVETLSGSGKVCGVFVLEHEAQRATELVKEFLSGATDDRTLEQAATQSPQADKETA